MFDVELLWFSMNGRLHSMMILYSDNQFFVSQQLHMTKLDWGPGDLDQGLEFLSNQSALPGSQCILNVNHLVQSDNLWNLLSCLPVHVKSRWSEFWLLMVLNLEPFVQYFMDQWNTLSIYHCTQDRVLTSV